MPVGKLNKVVRSTGLEPHPGSMIVLSAVNWRNITLYKIARIKYATAS